MTSRHPVALAVIALGLLASDARATSPAEELLADAIAYHDPSGVWGGIALRLTIDEPRSDGAQRSTVIELDPKREYFRFRTESEEATVEGILDGERCITRLDGSEQISDAARKEHRLTCDRVAWRRNYYSYLWGLPMKLRDPGTIVHPEVRETTFDGRKALEIKVTYDEAVGGDIWYFYFHPESHALTGYRFYHDEAKGDGEYILLEGETSGAGLRLPAARSWYMHVDDRHLGIDTLVSIERTD